MVFHLLVYLLSFIGIWIGAGLAISSVEKLSRSLKLSSFMVSFLVLGVFTSISEFSVGVNAVLDNDPEIFVGNLIGASIVIFMLIIPLLAITGKAVRINPELRGATLLAPLFTVALPVLLSLDGRIGKTDAILAITGYFFSTFFIESKRSILEKASSLFQFRKNKVSLLLLKIVVGIAIIFTASYFIVDQTLYFSNLLSVSPFVISLLVIAVGTNLPELSIVVRSMFMRSNQVAFGDYIGSASVNTLLFGVLTLWYGKPILLTNSYLISLVFLIIGLICFAFFARSKNLLTRGEGWCLLSLYIVFMAIEFYSHWG